MIRTASLVRVTALAALAAVSACSRTDDVPPSAPPDVGSSQHEVKLNSADLDFILRQIEISERHAAGGSLASLVGDPLLPFGLRTVSGTFNNLVPGQEHFGTADRLFPRMAAPRFSGAEPVSFDPDGPGPTVVGAPTSYAQTSGFVFDSRPRVISNLIVDQSANNPSAVAAAAQTPDSVANVDGAGTFFIPNVAPDEGLSAPYNSWFTLFGQFFDHGLDLLQKGGSGTVVIPLKSDDPLFVPGSATNFMVLTRATNQPGPDNLLGTADDVHEHKNQTSPFVDQNQTYTSHPAHQVFLREYVLNAAGKPVSTGRVLDGARGGIANWREVKEQARMLLGIQLSDLDVIDLPNVAADAYGKFIPGPNGFPMLITGAGPREGNPSSPVSTSGALRTGHAFLLDIAHSAMPSASRAPDADAIVTPSPQPAGTYDDELLAEHFCTGDGRGNENIGLTAVHTIFHMEHNRLVGAIKQLILDTANPTYIQQWLLPGAIQSDGVQQLEWNGERLFQAARFTTEMQYQHLVFEEFARKVQPEVNVFAGYDTTIDPAIMAEFAHVVYRFGHSMLTESLARTHGDGGSSDITLLSAFLNPVEFKNSGVDDAEATAAIVRGMTRQVGNEVDEFITGALRNSLLGLPLDLATINLSRGRDTGVPPLNKARELFFAATSDGALRPYTSWADYGRALRHPESLVNYVAAYGTHPSITAAPLLADKRAAADALVSGGATAPSDAAEFMSGTGAWANVETGLNEVDFWIGGLGEKQMIFGGLLGSTFNFVFETQLEKLQDGDRLYYLTRTAGLNFFTQLENNSFADMVMRNTGVRHLPADVFSRPGFIFELSNVGTSGPIVDDPSTPEVNEALELIRMPDGTIRYTGDQHVVMGGTPNADRIQGSEGDDTLYGDEGDDRIEGGDGNDQILGGEGNDIITDIFGIDNIKGEGGHDVINAGAGNAELILGGAGQDFIVAGEDPKETFGGSGNDFIVAGDAADVVFGDDGDDWIEGAGQADLLQGDHGDPFEESPIAGNDVIFGQGGNDDFHGESGDDILVSDTGIERHEGMLGFDWVTYKGSPQPADADLRFSGLLPDTLANLRDRFDLIEGLSGWNSDDILRGDGRSAVDLTAFDEQAGFNNALNGAAQIALVAGLQDVLGTGVSTFSGGNIILGGAGSDLLEGRGGDDLLDGDAWLNVRIGVVDSAGATIGTADGMTSVITGKAGPLLGTSPSLTLQQAMFSGLLHPGQLRIIREILTPASPGSVDTAVYGEPFANYDVTRNGDGSLRVAHARPTVANGPRVDGTDRLRNIEVLQFADQAVQASSVTTPSDETPPGPATALAISVGDGELLLTFVLPLDVSQVRVMRSTVGFATSPTQTANQLVVFDGAQSFFRDTGLTNGTTYFYTVFARDDAGNFSTPATILSAPLAGAVANPDPGGGGSVDPVSNLVQVAGDGRVQLSWVNPLNVTAVRILRSSIGFASSPADAVNQLQVFEGLATTFSDTGLVNGTTYYYTLYARDASGDVSTAATTTAMPVNGSLFADTEPPEPVSNLVQMPGDGNIALIWTNPTDAAAVRILRSTMRYAQSATDTVFQQHVFDAPGVGFVDNNLINGVTYFYTVYVRDTAGNVSLGAMINSTPAAGSWLPPDLSPLPGTDGGTASDPGGGSPGCGCSGGAGSLALSWGLLVMAALLRRRR